MQHTDADDRVPALDPQVADLLDDGLADPVTADLQDRVRTALLRRIAADSTDRHLTVAADGGCWRPFGEGLQIKVLHSADGIASYLVRMAAGASLPPHRHPVDEECLVLEGEVRIGGLRVSAGGFHLGRKDLPHDRLSSDHGALIFLRGARPEAGLAL